MGGAQSLLAAQHQEQPYDSPQSLAHKLGSGNGRPAVLAFLAPHCGLCASLRPALAQVEEGGRAAVVRLDSSKSQAWAPELLRYSVDTVPCFVLLAPDGSAVCKTPAPSSREQMEAALQAMVEHAARLERCAP